MAHGERSPEVAGESRAALAFVRFLSGSWAVTLVLMVGMVAVAAFSVVLGRRTGDFVAADTVLGVRLGASAEELRALPGDDGALPPLVPRVVNGARDDIGVTRVWWHAPGQEAPVTCALDISPSDRLVRTTCTSDRPVEGGQDDAALQLVERELVATYGPPHAHRAQGGLVQWTWRTEEARLTVFAQIVSTAPGRVLHVKMDSATMQHLWELQSARAEVRLEIEPGPRTAIGLASLGIQSI